MELKTQGIPDYSDEINYRSGVSYVSDGGSAFQCLINNGPSSSTVAPAGDTTGTWERLNKPRLLTTRIFNSSSNWNKPDNLMWVEIQTVGGGGGGGAARGVGSGCYSAGGGGGGGGFVSYSKIRCLLLYPHLSLVCSGRSSG